jgi:RNase P subunit RPR2
MKPTRKQIKFLERQQEQESSSISVRELTRKYNELLKRVQEDDYYKIDLTNRFNCYICSNCDNIIKTKDIDAGTTPSMFKCKCCGQYMRSTFYEDILPNRQHTIEWYRPTLKQMNKYRNNPSMLDHLLRGGLAYREVLNPTKF